MKKLLLLCCLLGLSGPAGAKNTKTVLLPIFPTPAEIQLNGGRFTLASDIRISAEGTTDASPGQELFRTLQAFPTVKRPGSIRLNVDAGLPIPEEGYELSITPKRITLSASSESGLFYAAKSLGQLIRASDGTLPACVIRDRPRMQWRGAMLDESRHFFGKETVFRFLDRMADLKLNVFHWHLTDEPGWRIEIKQYPKLTTIGATGSWDDATTPPQFYTQEEIREVVAYAARRHIMVVPEIDMPGHACSAGRAYPEISAGGSGRWKDFTYHPAREETYQFLTNILREVAGLFPSPYIHIGGDEVKYGNKIWYTDPDIQSFIQTNQLGDVLGMEHYFMRRMVDSVRMLGKTPIAWDEIVDAGVTPEEAVVMWWRHDEPKQLQKAVDGGYTLILTPRRPFYLDYPEHGTHKIGPQGKELNTFERAASFPADTTSVRWQGRESQILGLQGSAWTERIADVKRLDFMTFPRLIAVAEAAWTPQEAKNTARLMKKLPVYLDYLDSLGVYYFDPFDPQRRPEPPGPTQADVPEDE